LRGGFCTRDPKSSRTFWLILSSHWLSHGFIDYPGYSSYHSRMGKTKLKQEAVYLMPDKHELLLELAKKTRISRSELLREAVDDLLKKHGVLKVARR
jgi:hypothetical protein